MKNYPIDGNPSIASLGALATQREIASMLGACWDTRIPLYGFSDQRTTLCAKQAKNKGALHQTELRKLDICTARTSLQAAPLAVSSFQPSACPNALRLDLNQRPLPPRCQDTYTGEIGGPDRLRS